MSILPAPRERPLLSVAEVAQITGEGQKAIRSAIDAGQLPSIRIGRYVRLPTAALYELLGIIPDMDEDQAHTRSAATTNEVTEGPRHDKHLTIRAV